MFILEMLVTIAAWWVGTAMDPLFWILALSAGLLQPASLRVIAAVAYALLRCVALPVLSDYVLRLDWPLLVVAVAVEFWAIAWCVAHAPAAIAWWRDRKTRNARRGAGVGGSGF